MYSHSLEHPAWQFLGSDMNQAMIEESIAAFRKGRQMCLTRADVLRPVEVTLEASKSARLG